MSNTKKVRSYLESIEHREDAETIGEIEAEIKRILKKTVPKDRIKQCLRAIDLHINSKIDNSYDSIVNDFNTVDKVVHRCFSVSLSLNSNTSSQSISYKDLFEIIGMIDSKDTLPSSKWLRPNFPYV